jgi:hypothetical protein
MEEKAPCQTEINLEKEAKPYTDEQNYVVE